MKLFVTLFVSVTTIWMAGSPITRRSSVVLDYYSGDFSLRDTSRDPKNIVESFPELSTELKIDVQSVNKIVAILKFVNLSTDTLSLSKKLLPQNGKLERDIFSILSAKSYDRLRFKPDDTQRKFKRTQCDDLVKLNPKDSLKLELNLYSFYDFVEYLKTGDSVFYAYPDITMPLIKNSLRVFQVDPGDNILKPVSFIVSLPYKHDPDSSRVIFTVK